MGDRGRAVGVFPGIRYRYQISETKRGTSESPRHTWLTRYRCSLPGLAGFAGPRCTEPEVPRSDSQLLADYQIKLNIALSTQPIHARHAAGWSRQNDGACRGDSCCASVPRSTPLS